MVILSRHTCAAELFKGFGDTHCHLLPDVDDGAGTVEESLSLLDELEKLGVERICLTPHIKANRFENNEVHLRHLFEKFRVATDSKIELRLAAEYFVDSGFEEHLNGEPLTFANGALLVEFGFFAIGAGSVKTLFNASLAGYGVVIAHPERYSFMTDKIMQQLLDSGYRMQLTIPSIVGYYGAAIRNRALELLDKGVYSYLGSDIHNSDYIYAATTCQLPTKLFERLEQLKLNNAELY